MQLSSMDLERDLCSDRPKDAVTPHELDAFFRERFIPFLKIAQKVGVTESCLRGWLSGRMVVPPKRQPALYELRDAILRWEAKKGRQYDARDFYKK